YLPMKQKFLRARLFALIGVSLSAQADYGWTTLFDEKSDKLDGWTIRGGKATYDVKDGAIVGTNGPGHNTFLTTENVYGDFELEFEVLLGNPLNSGVQIRSIEKEGDWRGKTVKLVAGPQIEIEQGPGEAGYIYGERIGGWMTPKDKLIRHEHFKNDDWNSYRIVAQGPRIQTWVNGTQISDLIHEEVYQTHKSGFIGLQVHSTKNPTGTLQVSWRNIRIKEL
ncbi:MAG: DUF1080 domain-containing protein, partial [Verrucomicrobiota bacterium]